MSTTHATFGIYKAPAPTATACAARCLDSPQQHMHHSAYTKHQNLQQQHVQQDAYRFYTATHAPVCIHKASAPTATACAARCLDSPQQHMHHSAYTKHLHLQQQHVQQDAYRFSTVHQHQQQQHVQQDAYRFYTKHQHLQQQHVQQDAYRFSTDISTYSNSMCNKMPWFSTATALTTKNLTLCADGV